MRMLVLCVNDWFRSGCCSDQGEIKGNVLEAHSDWDFLSELKEGKPWRNCVF